MGAAELRRLALDDLLEKLASRIHLAHSVQNPRKLTDFLQRLLLLQQGPGLRVPPCGHHAPHQAERPLGQLAHCQAVELRCTTRQGLHGRHDARLVLWVTRLCLRDVDGGEGIKQRVRIGQQRRLERGGIGRSEADAELGVRSERTCGVTIKTFRQS